MTPAKKPPRPRRTTRAKLAADLKDARGQLEDRRGEIRAETIRRLERQAESSREHYAELYDYAPFGHLTLDANGVIRTLNLTAAALLERPRAHLIGRPLVVLVASADRRRFLSHISRLRHGQAHASTELELKSVNGRPVEVQMISVVRGKAKASGYEYHTALVDITERKRAEARTAAMARLGLLLSAASDPAAAARAIVETAQELCGWDACFLLLHEAADPPGPPADDVDAAGVGGRAAIGPPQEPRGARAGDAALRGYFAPGALAHVRAGAAGESEHRRAFDSKL
jgi:PAS domain S-box-containing protein